MVECTHARVYAQQRCTCAFARKLYSPFTGTLLSPSGVDLLMDVHGDEELPHVFVAGNEGIPRCALLACQQPAPGCSVQ